MQDEEGWPLPGITVLIRGTGTGDATNDQGNFELKADFAKVPVVLVVSSVGYAAQNIPLAGPTSRLVMKMLAVCSTRWSCRPRGWRRALAKCR